MATYSKRGGRIRCQVTVGGVRESGTFASKAEAVAWARAKEAGRLPSARAGTSLRACLRRYADEVSPTKRGARWEQVRLLSWIKRDWTDVPMHLLTTPALATMRDARLREVGPASVLREMGLLSAVLEHARKDWQLITTNPLKDLSRPIAPQPRRRRVTDAEVERLLLALDYRAGEVPSQRRHTVAHLVLLALETGARSGELCDLTWRHVFDTHWHLPRTKNGGSRDVALTPEAQAIMALWPRGEPDASVFDMTPAQRDALFRKARDRADVTDLHFHDLRSEAVYRLSKRLPLLDLARQIGHTDLSSLQMYYRATGPELAALLAKP